MRTSHFLGLTLIALGAIFGCSDSEPEGDDASTGGNAGSAANGGAAAEGGTDAGRGGSSGANTGGSSRGGQNTGGSNSSGGTSGAGQGGNDEGGAGAGGNGQGGEGNGGDDSGGSGSCMPITDDASSIGVSCEGGPCPMGYTCKDFIGVVLEQRCSILCQNDCECPAGLSCVRMKDKVSVWMECSH